MKKVLFNILPALVLLIHPEAGAQCSMTVDVAPLRAKISKIVKGKINPNLPDGTVIDYALSMYSGVQNNTKVNCTGGLGISPRKGLGTTGPYNTYRTSVPGLGFRISHSVGSGLPAGMTGPWPLSVNHGTQTSVFVYDYPNTVRVELVKIGEIKAGGTITGDVAEGYFKGTFKYMIYHLEYPEIVELAIPTCKVTTPSIGVFLGNVSASSFKGVGQTSTAVPLNIALTCSGGATGVNANVFVTLTDQTLPGNVSNVLTLNSASTAKGVGIQVLNGTTVISYGPDSNVVGNKNQWKAGTTANGVFNIPLTARYVQTDTTVKPGSANGRATFTMSYQ